MKIRKTLLLLLCFGLLVPFYSGAVTEVDITASGTWTVPSGVTSVDVFLVGGGGGGSSGDAEGAGGSGCNTEVYSSISVTPGASISVTIGAGGAGGVGSTNGSNGSYSEFASSSYRATGGFGAGQTGFKTTGSGSGGGSWGSTDGCSSGGDGGSDGSNGTGTSPGVGQGSTTRKWHEVGGTLFAGGGGGGTGSGCTGVAGAGGAGGGGDGGKGAINGTNGTENTGGGGGGTGRSGGTGGDGGSGFISIRYTQSSVSTRQLLGHGITR